MGSLGVGARLMRLLPAILLLLTAPAARPTSAALPVATELAPNQPGDRAEAPFDEGIVAGRAWLSAAEFLRGIERPRLPSGLAALAGLLATLAYLTSSFHVRPLGRGSPSSIWRIVAPRAPPLQLA